MIAGLSIWFLIVLILGIVGNLNGLRDGAHRTHQIWFWNIVWVVALQMTLI